MWLAIGALMAVGCLHLQRDVGYETARLCLIPARVSSVILRLAGSSVLHQTSDCLRPRSRGGGGLLPFDTENSRDGLWWLRVSICF